MAMGTQEIALGAVPVAAPLAVNPLAPVAEDGAVALAAETVGFVEAHQFAAGKAQMIAILDKFAQDHPTRCSTKVSLGQSIEGRDLWMVKISDNVTQDENEPTMLVVSADALESSRSVMTPLLRSIMPGTDRWHSIHQPIRPKSGFCISTTSSVSMGP